MGTYHSSKLLNILFTKAYPSLFSITFFHFSITSFSHHYLSFFYLFSTYAAKCPDPIWICASNPGYTESELGTKDPSSGEVMSDRPAMMQRRSTYEGAKTIIFASISPSVGESGGFYSNNKESETRKSTQGESGKQFADNVWKDTINILKKHVPGLDIYSW